MSSGKDEPEPQRSLKKLTWQSENCLSCVWFTPNDPLNADILERGACVHPKLKAFQLVVSGRDWCNLYTETRQKQIDILKEKAMSGKSEAQAVAATASRTGAARIMGCETFEPARSIPLTV